LGTQSGCFLKSCHYQKVEAALLIDRRLSADEWIARPQSAQMTTLLSNDQSSEGEGADSTLPAMNRVA
jgi:hypothetical protein